MKQLIAFSANVSKATPLEPFMVTAAVYTEGKKTAVFQLLRSKYSLSGQEERDLLISKYQGFPHEIGGSSSHDDLLVDFVSNCRAYISDEECEWIVPDDETATLLEDMHERGFVGEESSPNILEAYNEVNRAHYRADPGFYSSQDGLADGISVKSYVHMHNLTENGNFCPNYDCRGQNYDPIQEVEMLAKIRSHIQQH